MMSNSKIMNTFSDNELKSWVEMGLIPKELLLPNKQKELFEFIASNQELLTSKYSESKEFDGQIELPSADKWDETFELQVIDKRTGKVIKKLEKIAKIKLLEDIYLNVRAIELEEWKKDIKNLKKLSPEENQTFKEFINKYGSERPISRQEIATFIEEIEKKKIIKPPYRQSAHLIEQKLKYQKAQGVKEKIKESRVEVKVEGIRLTEHEVKLDHILTKLLSEKSQPRNSIPDLFYSGNVEPKIVEYGDEKRKVPVLQFKRRELYSAYLGHDDYGGRDAEFIDNLLIQFADKPYYIKYNRIKKIEDENGNSKVLTDVIEGDIKLIKILHFYPNLTEDERQKIDNGNIEMRKKKEEIIIVFHPIYIDQIETKFIEFPSNTTRRLQIAAGGWNKTTPSMYKLMEWSMKEMSLKRYKQQINEVNLISMLGLDNLVKQNRKKRLQERIQKDIETIKIMGIILKAEKKLNRLGDMKWVFEFNKEYV